MLVCVFNARNIQFKKRKRFKCTLFYQFKICKQLFAVFHFALGQNDQISKTKGMT